MLSNLLIKMHYVRLSTLGICTFRGRLDREGEGRPVDEARGEDGSFEKPARVSASGIGESERPPQTLTPYILRGLTKFSESAFSARLSDQDIAVQFGHAVCCKDPDV